MLPVFGRPYEGPTRHAVIGTRGLATESMIWNSSGGYCIERDVRLLRDPDAVKQHCQLASDGNDGSIAGLLASARSQVQAPLP
jgi:hypothetical protein